MKRLLRRDRKSSSLKEDNYDFKVLDLPQPRSSHSNDADEFSDVMHRNLQHHDEDSESNWLVSYADMMTLLFGFFVMLMSFSKIDVDSFEKAKQETTKYFGGQYIKPFEHIQNEIKDKMQQKQLAEQMHFDSDAKGITVTFQGALFFDPGSTILKDDAIQLLKSLVPVVQKQGPNMMIIIEGHTDDNPISGDRFPSNWELSAFRASTVLREFEKSGFNRLNLRAIGFGDTIPAVPNRDKAGKPIKDNQAQNRRVVLRIINTTQKY